MWRKQDPEHALLNVNKLEQLQSYVDFETYCLLFTEEPSPRGPTKQDLEQAKAREQELTARIVHIEGEAKKSMVAREKAASSLASLTTEFRAVAERSKNRGAMLAKLIGAVREVEDIKGRLEVCKFYTNNMYSGVYAHRNPSQVLLFTVYKFQGLVS